MLSLLNSFYAAGTAKTVSRPIERHY